VLTVDAERLAGGGNDLHPGAVPPDEVDQLGTGAEDVLAVVEDDEDVLVREDLEQSVERCPPAGPAMTATPAPWPPQSALVRRRSIPLEVRGPEP
jgi:hypothetical protein